MKSRADVQNVKGLPDVQNENSLTDVQNQKCLPDVHNENVLPDFQNEKGLPDVQSAQLNLRRTCEVQNGCPERKRCSGRPERPRRKKKEIVY